MAAALQAAEATLAGVLGKAFEACQAAGAAGTTALGTALDAGFAAFWLLPPIPFLVPTGSMVGVVTVAPPGVLATPLTGAFADGVRGGGTAKAQAAAIAGVLDAWTKTVMVVNTPVTPPGPPLPPVPLA